MLYKYMAKPNKVIPKKKRGRPATGRHPLTALRLPPNLTKAIEAWAIIQGDQPNRSEAIRRLIEFGLTVKPIRTRRGRSLDLGAMAKIEPATAKITRLVRARELAAEMIDKMGDPTAHPDERAQRRQRLTKGPPEFLEDRVDLPKVKTK
jgi:hypothetical protein